MGSSDTGEEYNLDEIELKDKSIPRNEPSLEALELKLGKKIRDLLWKAEFRATTNEDVNLEDFKSFRSMVFLRLRRTLMNKKTFKKDFMINLYKAHKSNRLVRDLLPGSNSFCEYCGGVALTFKHLLQESHITNYQMGRRLDPPHIMAMINHPCISSFFPKLHDIPDGDGEKAFLHYFKRSNVEQLMSVPFFKSNNIFDQKGFNHFTGLVLKYLPKYARELRNSNATIEKLIFLFDNQGKSQQLIDYINNLFNTSACSECEKSNIKDYARHLLSEKHLKNGLTSDEMEKLLHLTNYLKVSNKELIFNPIRPLKLESPIDDDLTDNSNDVDENVTSPIRSPIIVQKKKRSSIISNKHLNNSTSPRTTLVSSNQCVIKPEHPILNIKKEKCDVKNNAKENTLHSSPTSLIPKSKNESLSSIPKRKTNVSENELSNESYLSPGTSKPNFTTDLNQSDQFVGTQRKRRRTTSGKRTSEPTFISSTNNDLEKSSPGSASDINLHVEKMHIKEEPGNNRYKNSNMTEHNYVVSDTILNIENPVNDKKFSSQLHLHVNGPCSERILHNNVISEQSTSITTTNAHSGSTNMVVDEDEYARSHSFENNPIITEQASYRKPDYARLLGYGDHVVNADFTHWQPCPRSDMVNISDSWLYS